MVKAALLHDAIEDCGIDADFLRQKGYSEDCIAMIGLVTKPENDTRSYAVVIDDLIASGNEGAIKIKIADNAENLHPERLKNLKETKPEKAATLEPRYHASIRKLCEAVNMSIDGVLRAIANSPAINTAANDLKPR